MTLLPPIKMFSKPSSAARLGNRLFALLLRTPRSAEVNPVAARSARLTSSLTVNPLRLQQQQYTAATAAVDKAVMAEEVDANELVAEDLRTMFAEIHQELDAALPPPSSPHDHSSVLAEMSKYYFDGHGKAIRPVIAMTLGHAFNHHLPTSTSADRVSQQRKVAIISEMIHTSSLVHDDVLDHATTRRGKASVNCRWDAGRSAMCGDFILAVAAKILAQLHNEEVLIVLAQVLADLVRGEFQQMQKKYDEAERFQLYLSKTFHKTASLVAYSCKANAILAGGDAALVEAAFQCGRNVGLAFQLVDDLLDFEASSAMLGKPAAADLRLGLATAPVLFATAKFPELEAMIARRFSRAGDVEAAFEAVHASDGLRRTRELAAKHCADAAAAISGLKDSRYKAALNTLTHTSLTRKK